MHKKGWKRWPWRLMATVGVLVVVAGLIGRVPPAGANNSDDGAGHGVFVQLFEAGFEDGCGIVEGEFRWSATFRSIFVMGVLTDRADSQPPSGGCGLRATTATFTGYADGFSTTASQTVNDEQRKVMAGLTAPIGFDRIVLDLCRVPTDGEGTAICVPAVVKQRP